jgi:hypothetical protein
MSEPPVRNMLSKQLEASDQDVTALAEGLETDGEFTLVFPIGLRTSC